MLWKSNGINPLTIHKGDDAHGYNGKVFAFISILELVVLSVHTFADSFRQHLLPFWYLENNTLVLIGWGCLFTSLAMVWIAQSHMKASWRIGIDDVNKTQLITSGLFSFSRNPVFLGIMIANIGLFLVLPNAFTLMIISLSAVSINTQIRLEEVYLLEEFGDSYKEYFTKVSRWFSF